MCDSGQCIPLSKVCDRTVDCYDNSDEFAGVCALGLDNPTNFCGFECTFHNGTVGCAEHVLCDSIEDCNDGRDELRCRYRNTNKCFHVRCPDMCLGGPYERCACSEGFYLSPFDRRTCVGKPSCARANCSQICDDHETLGHACLCVDGYSLMENEVDCKMTAESTPYLVLATGHSIKVYTTAGHLEDVPSSSLTKPVAVDFDYQTETLYFIDIHSSSNRLMTMSLFSGKTEVVKVISKFPSRGVDGLAVDWLGRNIYYTDRHKETISMCNLDGHYHKVLLRGDPLIDPRAIVVDPHNGWLFWTDWGTTAHIGRMKMNGEGVEILIQDRTIVWPNALAVDPPASRLYFGDAHRDYIGYCSYDGTRRRILTKMAGKHIFAMSVFENYLYWTDWSSRTVEKVHKIAGENKDLVVHQMKKRPMGIKVFHPPFGFTNNTKDVCVKAGCDNLCAPIGDNKVACICAEGFRAEGKRCVSDCSPLDLVCRNTYKCIPKWWECDGQDDCGDAEDEFFYEKGKCEPFPCQPGQFKCTENEKNATTCLYTSMLCDGHDDCPNRDDELLSFCQHYKCSESQMKCADGSRCVPLTKVCDGRWDCEDGSDEVKCQNCGAGFFTCLKHSEHSNVTTCIVEEKYCDGHKDCPMGEDEPVSCPINYKACTTHQFQCENSECIGHERLCDGIKDCGDGEDEERCDYVCLARCHNKCFDYIDVCNGEIDRPECNGIDESHEACERKFAMHTDAWTAICTHNGGKACPNYNSCYQKSEKCDQIVQCHDDGADEVGCGRTCSSPNVLCKNGLGCVKPDQVCDGVADCTDGSDEISCYRVGLDDVKTTRQWVMAERMCDGVLDTFDGSDESDAACVNRTACPFPMLFCKDKRQCFVGLMGICDRVVDCADGFDESEHSCHMQNWIDTNEKDRSFQCNNGRYISIKERCDGKENCADGSDEDSCGSGCDVVGVCTQKCRQDSHNRTYCYCAPGYEQRQQNGACHPYGMSADIFISLTTHIEWFFMPQETSLHPTKMPPLKVSATTGIDIGFTYDNLTVMYTRAGADGHAKVSEVSPSKHLRSQIITDDLEELLPPEYTKKIVNAPIAVDHVHKNVYFADPADASYPNSYHHIFVTHPGSWNRAIVVYSVGTITSLAVAPNANRLFWTLTYPRAAIYSSELSGRTDHFLSKNGLKREPILTRNIYRPTSLTVDEPNGRIYWIEQGRRQIVSCRFDGKEVVTKRFDFNFAPLVMDLHVDELFVLFSTRRSMKDTKDTKTPLAELWAVHKFTGARRFLEITASEAATALKVAHSGNRHPFTSPFLTEFHANCTKCPEMAVCLPTTQKDNVSIEAECKCTMGTRYSRSKKDCTYYHMKVSPHSPMGAYTQCRRPFQCYNGATCNLKTNKCDCDRTRFAGDYCEVIPCFVDCASSLRCGAKESVGLARQCICPEFQKGETCAINLCDDQCGQHGKCVVNEDYGDTRYKLEEQDRVYCHCDIGWHGVRCQNGPWELFCNMQGQMVEVENQEVECICKSGRRGPRCQHCAELECQNNGVCAETAEGPVCKCPRGFGGVHCELDMCNGTCTTVEKCDYNPATPEIPAKCVCTPAAGHQTKDCQPMCGKNVNWCLFGGTCVDLVGQPGTCICPPRYTGARCEQKLECSEYCLNNGTCSITNSTHYTCDCPLTHFGDRCESAKGCELVCENGGTCVLDERADAHCKCPRGLGGESCEELIATSCESLECSNDAECTNLEEYGPPVCICKQGWHGSTCLLRECTPTYCYNQGKCFMENEFPKCRCPANFSGYQCEVDESKIFHASYGTYALLVGVMILSSITVCLCVRCLTAENGQQERMEDVPMQDLSEHVDQEAVLGDERASFINPAFDSLSVAFSVSDDTVRLLDHPVGPSCEEEEEEEEGGGGGEGAEEDSDITPNPVDPSL